jgi:putative phage-type endonuclease
MLSIEQLAFRRRRMMATDIAAVLGANPWKRPIDVWKEKLGIGAPKETDERTEWGDRLEDPIRAWYAQQYGVSLTVPGSLIDDDDDLIGATPDALAFAPAATRADHGLEIKTHGWRFRHLYGEPGSDQIPDWELWQCVVNLAVTRLPFWRLAAFIDNQPAVYRVERNPELEELARNAAHDFWNHHVLRREPPPPDGSSSWELELQRLFPAHKRADLVPESEKAAAIVAEMEALHATIAASTKRYDELAQAVKLEIGDAAGLRRANGEILTWKKNTDSKRVDWKAVALERRNTLALLLSSPPSDLALDIDLEEVEKRFTTAVTGARPFCVPKSWHERHKQ